MSSLEKDIRRFNFYGVENQFVIPLQACKDSAFGSSTRHLCIIKSTEGPAMFQQKNKIYDKSTGKSREEQKDLLSPGSRPQRKYVGLLAADHERIARSVQKSKGSAAGPSGTGVLHFTLHFR